MALRLMPERDCTTCTLKQQEEWGCYASKKTTTDGRTVWVRKAKQPLKVDGEDSWACPRQPIRERPQWWNMTLNYYGMFKKGHLPDQGGVSDQSHAAIRIFSVLDSANAECDRELAERKSKADRRAKDLKKGRAR